MSWPEHCLVLRLSKYFLQPHLLRLAKQAGPEGRLWDHDRHWVREQVKRICRLARVPVLHAQSMRGGHSSLAIRAGASPHLVAASRGHASPAVTLSNEPRIPDKT